MTACSSRQLGLGIAAIVFVVPDLLAVGTADPIGVGAMLLHALSAWQSRVACPPCPSLTCPTVACGALCCPASDGHVAFSAPAAPCRALAG